MTENDTKIFSPERMYAIDHVIERTGYSRGYVYKLMRDRGFPRPILAGTGSRSARWLGAELLAWLDVRLEEREAASVGS